MPQGPKTVLFVPETTTGDGAAYTAGDAVGGVSSNHLEFGNVAGYLGSGEVKQVVVTLQTAAAAELDLVLYNAPYTQGTNNSPYAEAAGDIAKSVGVINIPAASFKTYGGNVKRAVVTTSLIYTLPVGGQTLYGQLVVRGALTLTDVAVHVGIGVERG